MQLKEDMERLKARHCKLQRDLRLAQDHCDRALNGFQHLEGRMTDVIAGSLQKSHRIQRLLRHTVRPPESAQHSLPLSQCGTACE